MRRAHTSCTINAPIAQVWASLIDTCRYDAWNPFVPRVDRLDGSLTVGARIRLWVRLSPGLPLLPSDQRIVDLQPPRAEPDGTLTARWAYTVEGLLVTTGAVRGGRVQVLRQAPGGPVVYETEEPFAGWLSALLPMRAVQAGFEAQAAGLKAATESGAGV